MDLEANVIRILTSVCRMEGELVEIRKLSQRVSRLEQWMAWLKGAWAVLAALCALLFKGTGGR